MLINDKESPRNKNNVWKLILAHKWRPIINEINFDINECETWKEVKFILSRRYKYVLPVGFRDYPSQSPLGVDYEGFAVTTQETLDKHKINGEDGDSLVNSLLSELYTYMEFYNRSA